MASRNNVQPENPTDGLPAKSSRSHADLIGDITEDEWKEYYSTAYKPGSKNAMKMPLSEEWGVQISGADVEKIKVGFRSHDMDNKWDLLVEAPDEKGGLSLHILRSWLQEECYVLHLIPNDGGARIESITWEGNKNGLHCGAEQAKKEAIIVTRGHLDCEFEELPQWANAELWDSAAYTRLDKEA